MKTYRIAIIGCGGINRWAHTPAYLKMKDRVEVVALCDILPDRVKAFRDEFFPQAETYTDYREVLKRDDLDYVEKVYDYVTGNIVYDTELAANVPLGYIPEIDSTLERGKGICFDYASLMTALLRTQGIPTKLVVGYSGTAYHAWISVYLQEAGWVDKIIRFDGKSWSLMDPTLAASNDREDVKRYIGDGGNYIAKYFY